ncbi:unnamed protein product [Adineta steineri]|uniref:Major facilitator superfamily (MFS) profile domain-containing protein n=1 Tax=Adineta steineri TaxID=433720 RepID=A0A814P2M3_9BILA|nr:unnamed protein product [Adineta steineri]CAF3657054.1 unnamed protein product [Adineta steineri]CAF3936103.1 unnamed protein product [Adineta steineri]
MFPPNSITSSEQLHSTSNNQRWTFSLIWAVIIVTFSTSFVMGVNTGGPNLYNGFIIPWLRGYPFPCQKDDSTSQWIARVWSGCDYINVLARNYTGYYYLPAMPANSYVAQNFIDSLHGILFVVGATIGSFTGQYWYKYFTRRNAIIICMLFQVVASILMIFTLEIYHGYDLGDPSLLAIKKALENKNFAISLFYISRFLSGWSAGLSCVVTPIYLTDISPRTMRGEIVTYHQLLIVIGVFFGQIISLPWLLGQHDKWHWGMSWVGIFSLIGCFLIWTLYESPRWLMQDRQRHEAIESLRALRETSEIEEEIREIEREELTVNLQDLSLVRLFTSSRFRWPLLTSIVLTAASQFSGINTVLFYSHTTFSQMGILEDKVYWTVLSTGMCLVIATMASIKLVELFGRRPLILYPLAIIVVIMILLCVFLQINPEGLVVEILLLILIFIALFSVGLGTIPYLYPNEVFTISVRPVAHSFAMFSMFFTDALVIVVFPLLHSVFGSYVFLLFCICCLLSFVFLWLRMPETKSKRLHEIEEFWW